MGHPSSTTKDDVAPKKGYWRKFIEHVGSWMAHKDKDEWLKDMRGNLSLVATVISTMTFQFAYNPPGGVRPAKDSGDHIACTNDDGNDLITPCPGEAILAVVYPHDYLNFLYWNTVCFVASLSVCLLLVSGIPIHHRFPMWLLSIGMCITLTSLALTYLTAVKMVTPDPVFGPTTTIYEKLLYGWIGLLGLLGFFLTLRFLIWAVNLFINKTSKASKNTKDQEINSVTTHL
ncbi:PGG domain [Sesbania bispinosa]|nr:PGG domain [Sesbania bispinosa]